jgi:uncharacterized protein (DUF2062 family)
MKKNVKKFIVQIYKHVLISFKENRKNPHYLALSFAIGLAAGMFPPLGQAGICFIVWLILDKVFKVKFSLIISSLSTLVSNPLTTPFWYYAFYLTGQAILAENAIPFSVFVEEIKEFMQLGINWQDFWNSVSLFLKGVFYPIMVGSIPWYFIMGGLGYYLGYSISLYLRRRDNMRKKTSIRKFIVLRKTSNK